MICLESVQSHLTLHFKIYPLSVDLKEHLGGAGARKNETPRFQCKTLGYSCDTLTVLELKGIQKGSKCREKEQHCSDTHMASQGDSCEDFHSWKNLNQ